MKKTETFPLIRGLGGSKKGFSLVELMVVITIIAILSVVAYQAMGGHTITARDSKRMEDLGNIQSALELYFVQYGRYPAVLENGAADSDVEAPAGNDWKIPKKYLSIIPTDPGTAKRSYVYTLSETTTYELATTLEKDGNPINYEAYVVGNSDTPLTVTAGVLGKYNNGGALATCTPGRKVKSGIIGTSDADDKCIPYDPNS
jgi:prepilin-type N-terminal cleavage/methylation domain-containing protein